MNTKTMRLPPRRVLTSNCNKRKEREGFDSLKPSTPITPTKLPKPTTHQAGSDESPEPDSSNQLLAGYLAHEFLTKGTLFGQPWDRTRDEAVPVPGVDSKRVKPSHIAEAEPSGKAEPTKENYQRYLEVSSLLKIDGAQLRGIFNPTELARFLHM